VCHVVVSFSTRRSSDLLYGGGRILERSIHLRVDESVRRSGDARCFTEQRVYVRLCAEHISPDNGCYAPRRSARELLRGGRLFPSDRKSTRLNSSHVKTS